MRPHVRCSIIYNRQEVETTQVSTIRYVGKENVRQMHIHSGTFSHL